MTEVHILVLVLVFVAVSSIVWSTWYTGISPMPSSKSATRQMLAMIPDGTNGCIYELGSGWGNLAISASSCFPGATVVGYELSLLPWSVSCLFLRALGRKNLQFKRRNFFDQPLGDADVVLCYLYPGGMSLLAEKLGSEIRPGTVVISNCFRMPGWTPVKTVELRDLFRTRIYFYVFSDREG
jgi:hypothetical protein